MRSISPFQQDYSIRNIFTVTFDLRCRNTHLLPPLTDIVLDISPKSARLRHP